IQIVALDLVGRGGDHAAIADIISALTSDDLEVKEQAVETLGQLGGLAAIEALLRALRAEHSFLDRPITRALIQIGSEAVPYLVDALADPNETIRWHAAEALADIGDPRAIESLVGVLEDADSAVRWNAARGLAHLGEPALIKLLEALETRPLTPWLSQGARYVLRHVALGRSRKELRALAGALDHPTASVEVPLRAEEAIAALTPAPLVSA
ncbi:MAG TPA: HEAT repeat domain-containing protein, partial [Chloroflexota bacterium]|nr:HEAT repeat domain-containing protein [Chloroflexota bacterium]